MPARVSLGDVERARAALARHLRPTPLRPSLAAPGTDLLLKLECWQPTGSFKVRGATYLLSTLGEEERRHGVVAASAGNHALGVAFAASRFAGTMRATLFVPRTAPRAKVDKLRRFPVEVRETGETYDDAVEAARAFERETGATFVPAYEDVRTAAGQGTIGLEILDECPEVAAVLVPGGGRRADRGPGRGRQGEGARRSRRRRAAGGFPGAARVAAPRPGPPHLPRRAHARPTGSRAGSGRSSSTTAISWTRSSP